MEEAREVLWSQGVLTLVGEKEEFVIDDLVTLVSEK